MSLSFSDILRRLKAAGGQLVRVKGDHHHFKHNSRAGIVTVPHPKKDLPLGTIRAIEKQSGIKLL